MTCITSRACALAVLMVLLSACSASHSIPPIANAPSTVNANAGTKSAAAIRSPSLYTNQGTLGFGNFLPQTITVWTNVAANITVTSSDTKVATIAPASQTAKLSNKGSRYFTPAFEANFTVTPRVIGTATITISDPLKHQIQSSITVEPYASKGSWKVGSKMPTGRVYLGAAASGGTLYAVGGEVSQCPDAMGTVDAFDTATNTWSSKTSMPTARLDMGVAAVNGMIYAVGGLTSDCSWTNAVEAYNTATDSWSTKATGPYDSNLDAATLNGKIYVGNGWGGGFSVYDPSSDTWTVKTPISSAHTGSCMAAANGHVYVFGGGNSGIDSADVYAYDPATDSWSAKASLPASTSYCTAGAINGTIFVAGSGYADPSALEGYDIATNTWTRYASLPFGSYAAASAVINGKLYVVGGLWQDALQIFTP